MAQLIVRNIEESISKRLKKRAAANGVSMEEEHRRILRSALAKELPRESFKEFLMSIPDAGSDADFQRIPQSQREVKL
ncbi:MAG: DNA-binding protein [Deltaproteobacteria bacterium]|nr:DNA-binding protein [Deltaproteobacteria bacterium]